MLVVCEGIDGAGKSTVARLVFDRLLTCAPGASYRTKRDLPVADAYGRDRLERLRDLIWHDNEGHRDPFGAPFWIQLLSAWYTALEPSADAGTRHELRVYDGWFYRNIVKTRLRSGVDEEWIRGLFRFVAVPDAVVLIDVDPAVAWQRTTRWKATELGRWDGRDGDPREAFCAYQSEIRAGLLAMAAHDRWCVVSPPPMETPDQVADRVAGACLAALPGIAVAGAGGSA